MDTLQDLTSSNFRINSETATGLPNLLPENGQAALAVMVNGTVKPGGLHWVYRTSPVHKKFPWSRF